MKNRYFLPLLIFILGFTVAVISLQFSVSRQLMIDIGHSGVIGALISGALYSFTFTSSIATLIFATSSYVVHPLVAAFFGGLGAAIYDMIIFTFIRGKSNGHFFDSLKDKMHSRSKIANIILSILGLFVLASPLPDELAAGFLGFSKLSIRQFVLISFLANAFGIWVILLVGH